MTGASASANHPTIVRFAPTTLSPNDARAANGNRAEVNRFRRSRDWLQRASEREENGSRANAVAYNQPRLQNYESFSGRSILSAGRVPAH